MRRRAIVSSAARSEDEERVESAARGPPEDVVAARRFPVIGYVEVRRRHLLDLLDDGAKIGDAVVDYFLGLVGDAVPRCHVWGAAFYASLCPGGPRGYRYENVRRWSPGADPLAAERILVPIFESRHWMLAVVDLAGKRVRRRSPRAGGGRLPSRSQLEFYNSLRTGGAGEGFFEVMRAWIADERARRGGGPEVDGWPNLRSGGRRVPRQASAPRPPFRGSPRFRPICRPAT